MEIHGAKVLGDFKPQEYEVLPLFSLHAHLGRIIYVKNANNDTLDPKDNYFFGTLSGWISLTEITEPNGCGSYIPYLGGTGAIGNTGGSGSPGSSGGTGGPGGSGHTGGSGGSGGSGGTGGTGGSATGGTGGTGNTGETGNTGGSGFTGGSGGTGATGQSGGTGISGGTGGTGLTATGGSGGTGSLSGGTGGTGGQGGTGGTGGSCFNSGGSGGTGGTGGTGLTGGTGDLTGGTGGVGTGGTGGLGGTGATGGSGKTGGTGGTGIAGNVKAVIGEKNSPRYFRIFNVIVRGVSSTQISITLEDVYNGLSQNLYNYSPGNTYGIITYPYEKTYIQLNLNCIYCEVRTLEQQYADALVDCWVDIYNNKINLYFDNKQLIYPFVHLTDIGEYLQRSNEYIIYQLMCICK